MASIDGEPPEGAPAADPLRETHTPHAVLWLVALAFIGAGLYLSHIRFMGAEWLSRAGCAVVILGIWSGLGGIIQERLLRGRLEWRHRAAIARAARQRRGKRSGDEALDKEIAAIEKAYTESSAALTQRLRLSLGIVEVSLLMTGTFLWGFGDLFFL